MPTWSREREEHAMNDTMTVRNPTTTEPRAVIERFVDRIAAQDLDGVVALYGPDALWEVHVPGWDGVANHPAALYELHHGYFVQNRDAFSVDGYQLLADGDAIALRWDLSWRESRRWSPIESASVPRRRCTLR
jgi:ketosteroid isomerase-like protein